MTDTIETNWGEQITEALDAHGPIEHRTVGVIGDVSESKRQIELIAVPYDEEALVEYPPGSGQLIVESVAPGAFEGVQTRTRRIPVNRDHDDTRVVGKVLALHPSRVEGLVAEVRISPTMLGDETLALAADGVLGASVGMGIAPRHQQWTEQRSRRRVMKAFLGHIALAANEAYAGASVLAIRSGVAIPQPVVFEPVVDEFADDVRAWLQAMRSARA